MKYFLIVIALLLSCEILFAQNLRHPLYKEDNKNGLSNITSDYGPRNYPEDPKATKFHSGIDYHLKISEPAYAIEEGELSFKENGTASLIKVGKWEYVHVLKGQYWDPPMSSDRKRLLWNLEPTPNSTSKCNLLTLSADGNLTMFSSDNNMVKGKTYWATSDEPTVIKKKASIGDIVFRSSLGHLHLQYADTWINPLKYIYYEKPKNYVQTLGLRLYYNDNNKVSFFPNSNIIFGDNVIIESDVNYIGGNDLNAIEIVIISKPDIYKNIAKWVYSGAELEHVQLNKSTGAYTNGKLKYHQMYQLPFPKIQNDVREGIFPVKTGLAYHDIGHDIFKRYWNTQENWNTDNPTYPDGNHTVSLTTEDIRGNKNKPETACSENIVIDNFKPYIKKVVVKMDPWYWFSKVIYQAEWIGKGEKLYLDPSINDPCKIGVRLKVYIYPSEPMYNIDVTFDGNSGKAIEDTKENCWIYEIPGNRVKMSSEPTIQINSSSKDLAFNGLWGLPKPQDNLGTEFPKRGKLGEWGKFNAESSDVIHKIKIYNTNPEEVKLKPGPQQAIISWVISRFAKPLHYFVYKSDSKKGPYTKASNNEIKSNSTSIKTTITNLPKNTKQWFYVTAVYASEISNGNKKSSAFTEISSDTISTPDCEIANNLTVSNLTTTSARLSYSLPISYISAQVEYRSSTTSTSTAIITKGSTSIDLKGLRPSTAYYYQIITKCENEGIGATGELSFTTSSPCITPGTPTNVKAFTDSPTTANFSWSAGIPVGTADVTYYWSVGKTSYVTYDNGLKKGTSTGTTASVTGLDPGTTYYFSVSAKSSCNNKLSAYGKSGSFKTPLKPTCDVTKVSSGSITSSSARIFFTLPQTVSTAKLEYSISTTAVWSSKDLAKSATYADLTLLKSSTKYYYRIKSECSTGGMGTSAVNSFTTLQAPYCAVATAYMASGSIGADKARIMVKLPAGIKGATLEYKIKGAGNWTQLTLTKTTTFVDLTNLSASTSYQYHVLTECINSGIGASTEYNFTTLAVPSCGAAGNLSAGSITPTGAIIKYTLPPKLLTATLEYKISENAPTLTKFLGISSTSFSLTGLIPGATYLYRIRTVCTNNLSNVSDEKSFTTIADLTVNAPATTAAISVGGESDWYKFQTGTAGVYSIHTQGGIDTRIFLFKNDLVSLIGEVKSIYNAKTGDYNGLINSNLSSNTWYYVKISGNLVSTQGFYTIEATSIKATLNLTVNAPPSPARLSVDSENDWYLFQTGEAGVYTIQTYGSTDTFMEFYEGNKNNKIGEDDSSASNELYDYNAMISKRLKAYTWYYVKIRGCFTDSKGDYSIGLTDWQIFSPPINLTSKAGNTQGTLTWQAPSSGVLGYKVYWSNTENGTFSAISATNAMLTLPVVNLVNGTAYWFYVTAVYAKGESKASNKVRLIAINNEYKSVVLSQDETNVLATNISAADAKLNLTPPDSLSLSTLDYRNQMVETTTSINTGFRVSCYPNPANRTLFVKVSGGDEELIGLQIINLSGKVIYKSKFLGGELQTIDIQNHPTGVYILNFTKSGEVVKPVKVIFNLTK